MRECSPELHRQRVSSSLIGKLGEQSRRWLGNNASYSAKHMWILKHWGKASHCDFCHIPNASRYEWANKYHNQSRNIEDFHQLCPSCHRLYDQDGVCRKGHPYTPKTTYVNSRGHRRCLICKAKVEELNAKIN